MEQIMEKLSQAREEYLQSKSDLDQELNDKMSKTIENIGNIYQNALEVLVLVCRLWQKKRGQCKKWNQSGPASTIFVTNLGSNSILRTRNLQMTPIHDRLSQVYISDLNSMRRKFICIFLALKIKHAIINKWHFNSIMSV